MTHSPIAYILVMAIVTYLIRVLPMVLLKKKIENKYVQSFLYYMPYVCLAAMTFPGVLYATGSLVSALVGFAVAIVLALFNRSMITVALSACAAAFIVERLIEIL